MCSPCEEHEDEGLRFGFSPRRNVLRRAAFEKLRKQAQSMQMRSWKKDGRGSIIDVGTVVQIAAAQVDRAKTDASNITAVVVAHEFLESIRHYRVASHAGTLKSLYSRDQLKPLPHVSPDLMKLADVLAMWETMPTVGERACMRVVSSVGGQGHVHCNCAGPCINGKCKCHTLKRLCNSRCHRNNSKCKNKE